jgi:uncharacterized membrane protein
MERREKCFRNLTFVLFILFLLWSILQFLAPIILPENSVQDLSGVVAISDNEGTINRIDFPWNYVYSAGDRLCHQKSERSFILNSNQMPFCSRCTAIWVGLTIGLGFIIFYRVKLNEKLLLFLIIGIAPMALDGIGQLLNLWESTNLIRVITGLIVGIVCGVTFGVIIDEFREIKNNKILTKSK